MRSLFLRLVLVAGLAEFVLLRVVMRLGPVLPQAEALELLYQAAFVVGVAAMNLAFLAGLGLLALAAISLVERRRLEPLAAASLVALLAFGAPLLLGAHRALLGWQAVAALALLSSWLVTARPAPATLRAGQLAAVATALAFYPSLAGLGQAAMALPGTSLALTAAETAATLVPLALAWPLRQRWRRSDLALGALPAVLLLGAWMGARWMVGAAAMWSFAFALFLPGPVYALALGLFLASLRILSRGDPAERQAALGLALVALAGLKMDFAYFAVLALSGYLVLGLLPAEQSSHPGLALPGTKAPSREAAPPVRDPSLAL